MHDADTTVAGHAPDHAAGHAVDMAVAEAGPSEGTPVRLKVHSGLCRGLGECHRWVPEVYELGDDGMIGFQLLEVPAELAERARVGASVCPERAITVIEVHPGDRR